MSRLHRYRKPLKKLCYMANTNRSKLLDSFYFDNQTWGALHKAWKGYVNAKNKHEYDHHRFFLWYSKSFKKSRIYGCYLSSL